MIFRVLAGSGIGGEYSAINSAIDELVPARVRGRVALAINSSWWIGTAVAAGLTVVLLNSFAVNVGWRARLRARRDPRDRDPLHPPPRAGEPALAPHARARRRGGEGGARDRGRGAEDASGPARARGRAARDRAARVDRLHRDREARDGGVPGPRRARVLADGVAGGALQRDALRDGLDPDDVLPRVEGERAALHHPVRDREPARPVAARPALRHGRAQDHDLVDVSALGRDRCS